MIMIPEDITRYIVDHKLQFGAIQVLDSVLLETYITINLN